VRASAQASRRGRGRLCSAAPPASRVASSEVPPAACEARAARAQVGECLGSFWRPSFDLAMFPYLPAHCTRPKEVRKLFLVPLPEKCYFAVRAGGDPAARGHKRWSHAEPCWCRGPEGVLLCSSEERHATQKKVYASRPAASRVSSPVRLSLTAAFCLNVRVGVKQ